MRVSPSGKAIASQAIIRGLALRIPPYLVIASQIDRSKA